MVISHSHVLKKQCMRVKVLQVDFTNLGGVVIMDISLFLQHLVNAISLGFVFGLVAVGYALVYGVVKLVNFAHGDVFMMAAYFMFYTSLIFGAPWLSAVILGIVLTSLLGVGIEKVAYKPLRKYPRINSLVSSIGMSFLLQNFAVVVFGGIQRSFPVPEPMKKTLVFGEIRVQAVSVYTIIFSIIVVLILTFILQKTKIGLAMRILSRDFDTARLMGINVNRTISFTFALGSALAAVSAVFWALRYPQIFPFMGQYPGSRAFIAAVVGGIGSLKGALIGGFVLGLLTVLIPAFFPEYSGYREAFIFLLLVLVLIFKPNGLFGQEVGEKA